MFFNHYGKREFWESEYNNNSQTFNWFLDFDEFKDLIYQYIKDKNEPILNIGCGTDETAEKLYKDGFQAIINIDFSKNCINKMKEKYKDISKHLIYIEMDCLDMAFHPNNFKFIIDKGTLDCLVSGYRSNYNVKKYLKEVYDILKLEGKFFLISQQEPEVFSKYVNSSFWNVEYKVLYNSNYIENKLEIKQEYVSFSENLFRDKTFENQKVNLKDENNELNIEIYNEEKIKENINIILNDLKKEKNNIDSAENNKKFYYLYFLTKIEYISEEEDENKENSQQEDNYDNESEEEYEESNFSNNDLNNIKNKKRDQEESNCSISENSNY